MKKIIILVSLDWESHEGGNSGLGIASIAASLKHAGIQYHLVEKAVNADDFDYNSLEIKVINTINQFTEQGYECLIGIGTFIWNEQYTQKLTKAIHHLTSASIVLGGPQISYLEVGKLECNYPYAKFFVRGYGEKAMVAIAIATATATDNAPMETELGIHIAGQQDLGNQAKYSLHDLPSPWLTGIIKPTAKVRWETSRGCIYACSFCQHRASGKNSNYIEQQFNVERIAKEACKFVESGVQRISILDPIFHQDKKRAVKLLRMLNEMGLRAQLALQCRFELVNDEFLNALEGLDVVLEFGLQTAIEEEGRLINRHNDLEIAKRVIQRLKAQDIPFEVSLIYGLPGQTVDSFRQSLDWCSQQEIRVIRAWPLMILRGTQLDKQRDEFGLVESSDQIIPHVIASNSFSAMEYQQMAELVNALQPPRIASL